MIKAKGLNAKGQDLYVFGISAENCSRLMLGKPIGISLAEMGGPDIEIIIFGALTDQMLFDVIKPRLHPDAEVSAFKDPHG